MRGFRGRWSSYYQVTDLIKPRRMMRAKASARITAHVSVERRGFEETGVAGGVDDMRDSYERCAGIAVARP